MSKKALWMVIGAVVIIGGIVMFSGGSDVPADTTGTDDVSEVADNSLVAGAFTGSGSIKCDYNQTGGLIGTAYVKGGKIRIEGTVEGVAANVIYTNGKVYNWGKANGVEYGIVIDAPAVGAAASAGSESLPSAADIQSQFTNGTARCGNYSVADSFFTPPPSVKFQNLNDLQNMMPAGVGPTGY